MRWNSFAMQSQVRADATAEGAWATLADVARWPDWSRVCISSSTSPGFGWKTGDRLSFKLRMAGVPVPFEVEITEIERGRRVAWQSTEFTVTAVRTITIEPGEGGIEVSDHKAFHSPVLPIGFAYPRVLIRRMTESWLTDLAEEAARRSRA